MIEFGLSPADFRHRYFEQQPYLRTTAMSTRPLQWHDLDTLLQTIEPDEGLIQLFNNGQLPPHSYIDEGFELGRPRRRLNKPGLYVQLQNGATLVINRMESFSVPAKRLCAAVGRFAGHQCTGNAYVSFGGKGTFGKHWDTHDVFAIQLMGRKRWQVFAPSLPLPMSHQTSTGHQHECPVAPVLDCVLSAGDMLYVPRGWWHQTIPFEEASLHLSVGVYVPTLSDYIMWACSRRLPQLLQARKGLLEPSQTELNEVMQAVTRAVLDQQQLAAFNQDLRMRERLSGEFDLGLFLDGSATLTDDAMLCRNSVYAVDTERGDVPLNGGQLRLEPVSRAVLAQLSATSSLTLAQLFERLSSLPRQAIRAAVLDLARYELLNVHRRAHD